MLSKLPEFVKSSQESTYIFRKCVGHQAGLPIRVRITQTEEGSEELLGRIPKEHPIREICGSYCGHPIRQSDIRKIGYYDS
jgi:hypothetical protein